MTFFFSFTKALCLKIVSFFNRNKLSYKKRFRNTRDKKYKWHFSMQIRFQLSLSLFQAPREKREGEGEGMKTRGDWGREKGGKEEV